MRQTTICIAFAIVCSALVADETLPEKTPLTEKTDFKPFTGKITRNKVRMRLKPNLDCPILRELSHEDLVIVTGESEDFYIIKPPTDLKAYVFRTFVLDNFIEGNHVNVRMEPDTAAPIIGQLNSGDRVDGIISALNSKWLEIEPPLATKFYICKEYVENIGNPSLLQTLYQRREDVTQMLENSNAQSQAELQKPYEKINLEPTIAVLNKIINQYSDFPSQVTQAKEILRITQEAFLQKKLAYLEYKTSQLENKDNLQNDASSSPSTKENSTEPMTSSWDEREMFIFQQWAKKSPTSSLEEFYTQQHKQALKLTGIIEPYVRPVRNKPGNYILISKTNRLPVAYLYSTLIDLSSTLGKEVTLAVVPRPNYDFAFPAYFVLAVE
jgi:hypothetical protein